MKIINILKGYLVYGILILEKKKTLKTWIIIIILGANAYTIFQYIGDQ